ncbi:hypothetical protein [Methylobacterium sp. D48H]
MTQNQSSQYVITAKAQQGFVQQTRVRAASAIVLAKAWIEAGHDDVRVVDPNGETIRPKGYRRAIMGGIKLYH